MNQHSPPLGASEVLVAEILTGTAVAHFLQAIPPWLGGGLTALFVGVMLRIGDPVMRALGDRLAARVTPPPPAPPAPPSSAP